MIELTEFLPGIRERAPGCPEPAALNEIRQAAITFCERTRLWRDSDSFQADMNCDHVCTPVYAELIKIESATLDGEKLQPISLHELDNIMPGWEGASGNGQYITQIHHNTVKIVPAGHGTVTLRIILKPAKNAELLPKFLLSNYKDAITDGALAELLLLPAQPFTNPGMASFHSQRFDGRITALFAQSIKGQQGAPLRTRAHYF